MMGLIAWHCLVCVCNVYNGGGGGSVFVPPVTPYTLIPSMSCHGNRCGFLKRPDFYVACCFFVFFSSSKPNRGVWVCVCVFTSNTSVDRNRNEENVLS